MYDHLCGADIESPNKKIWKAKIPLKIKIFHVAPATECNSGKRQYIKKEVARV
jgi:hypothetical protein